MSIFTQMMSFIRVVEARSFARAAERLNVSSAAVSKQIGLLEADIGQALLIRSTREVALSELGSQFYAYCKQLEKDMDFADRFVDSLQNEPRGELNVLSSVFFANEFLIPHLLKFQQRYPLVQVNLEINDRIISTTQEKPDVLAGSLLCHNSQRH